MAVHIISLIYVISMWLGTGLAQENCSTDDNNDESVVWCTVATTTSITTEVTFSQTSTLTSITTVPLTTASISGSVLIEPTILTTAWPPNPTSQSSTPTPNAASSGNRPHALAPGAKAGIGIGTIAAICFIAAVVWLLRRRLPFSKQPKEPTETEAVEKPSTGYGTVHRPELDNTDVASPTSDATLIHKGPSYQSYQASVQQVDNPGTGEVNESRPADELFIPAQERRFSYKPRVFITNADSRPESGAASPTRSDPGRPQALSVGRRSGEVSIRPSVRSSQDEHGGSASHAETAQVGTVSGLIEQERRLDEQIAEAKRLKDLYQQKGQVQAQLRERELVEEKTDEEEAAK